MKTFCSAKIQNATVTDANLHYEGSITIDAELMERCGIAPYEQVHVLNVSSGERIITYAIAGTKGQICLNGAAARLFQIGDKVIIIAYEQSPHLILPTILLMNDDNSMNRVLIGSHEDIRERWNKNADDL